MHHTCEIGRRNGKGTQTWLRRMGETLFLLLLALIGFHFDALHNVLQSSPLFGSHRHEFKTEFLGTVPPHNRLLDFDGGFVVIGFDLNIEGRPWLDVG